MAEARQDRIGYLEYREQRDKGKLPKKRPRGSLRQLAEEIANRQPLDAPRKFARYVVGVDPGTKTGLAVFDRESRALITLQTTDFWGAYEAIRKMPVDEVSVRVEVHRYCPTFRERKRGAGSVGTLDRMARNVGQVTREATLLVEGLRRCGYSVVEVRPQGKIKGDDGKYDAEEDRAQFLRLTGWQGQTSQHARDAGRIAWGA